MNGSITESEHEFFFQGKEKEDAFDAAAKRLFVVLGRLRHTFRGNNLRATGTLSLKEPLHKVDKIRWSGIRGDFMIKMQDKDHWIPLSEVSADRPWLMIPLVRNGKELFQIAFDIKQSMSSDMGSCADSGEAQIAQILENK